MHVASPVGRLTVTWAFKKMLQDSPFTWAADLVARRSRFSSWKSGHRGIMCVLGAGGVDRVRLREPPFTGF